MFTTSTHGATHTTTIRHPRSAADDDYTDLLDLDAEVLHDYWSTALDWVRERGGRRTAGPAARPRRRHRHRRDRPGPAIPRGGGRRARRLADPAGPGARQGGEPWPRPQRVRTVEADLDLGWPDLGCRPAARPDLGFHVAAPHGRPRSGAARRARRHPPGRADRGGGVRPATALPPRRPGLRPAGLREPDRRRARPRARGGDADPRLGLGAATDRRGLDTCSPSATSRSTWTRRRTRTPPGTPGPGSPGCRRAWRPARARRSRHAGGSCSTRAVPTRCCTAPTCTSAASGPSPWPAGASAGSRRPVRLPRAQPRPMNTTLAAGINGLVTSEGPASPHRPGRVRVVYVAVVNAMTRWRRAPRCLSRT